MTDGKEVHLDGKENGEKVRGVEEGKIIIKTYDMRKKNPIFTKMKKILGGQLGRVMEYHMI